MDNYSIKENISRRRKELGLSQSEVAEKIGVSRNSYRSIEKGKTRLVSEFVEPLADVLDMEELLFGSRTYSTSEGMKLIDPAREYASLLDSKEQTIRSLKESIESKDEIIRYQDEMIKMLKKIAAEK